MKRVLVLYLILFNFSSVFSQDLKELVQEQAVAIDSLQKQVIKPLNDSIIKLNSAYISKMSEFQEQIKTLQRSELNLNNNIVLLEVQITELNEDNVIVERNRLQTKVDSLSAKVTELKKIISLKEEQIEEERQFGVRKSREEKENGKQEVFNQIILFYNKPFDKLIEFSTISSVKRDLLLVRNNNEAQLKLQNLQNYFLAKQVLSEKYNENNINSALAQISSLDTTEFVKNLTDLLSNYKLCNSVLKTTIDDILVIDKQMIANDEYSQEKKLQKILPKLTWYLRNYRVNFSDYPYLSEIVLEIMIQKQKDANTNISNFLDEL